MAAAARDTSAALSHASISHPSTRSNTIQETSNIPLSPSLLSEGNEFEKGRDTQPSPSAQEQGPPQDHTSSPAHTEKLVKSEDESPIALYATLVLSLGLVVLLGVYSFIAFLWFGGPSGKTWRKIMLSQWVARSVTLASLVIRWTISLQAVLCTSVLAFQFLVSGANVRHVLRMATMRYNNSGPGEIIILYGRELWKMPSKLLVLLTLLLGGSSLLSQFTSTILFTDLGPGVIRTFDNVTHVPITFTDRHRRSEYESDDPLLMVQNTYPLFAEYLERRAKSDAQNSDDTGPAIRALLPVTTSSDRSKLLDF